MFTIKKATTNDIQLINEMAQIVFPATWLRSCFRLPTGKFFQKNNWIT